MSSTYTNTTTFTVTHAKYLASKVATDLKRIQRLYGHLTDERITNYEAELIHLLKAGYLEAVTYGFKRNGKWIEPTLRYSANDILSASNIDDDPGKIMPNADITDASFYSYLIKNSKWGNTSQSEKDNFLKTLPFQRGDAEEPGINGYLSQDKNYSSGGKTLERKTVKSY